MKNLWDFYKEYVFNLDPILSRMTEHGVRIDTGKQALLRAKVTLELESLLREAHTSVPKEVLPTCIWKKQPKGDGDYEEISIQGTTKKCSVCGAEGITKAAHLKGGKKNPCHGASITKISALVPAWKEYLPFNPLSVDQLTTYAEHFDHKLGKNLKNGNATLDEKTLTRLAKLHRNSHPIYGITKRVRQLTKVRSNYIDGFTPDASGRLTGYFAHNPETFRLSMHDVNLMNVSHRESALYAEDIRECIIPRPGHVLVEADSTAVEAVFTGYYAGDHLLIEKAALGIHAGIALKELGMEFTPENVKWVKKNKPALYERIKRMVHLTNYGGTYRMLAGQFPEIFDAYAEELGPAKIGQLRRDHPNILNKSSWQRASDAEVAAWVSQQSYAETWPSIPKWWETERNFAAKHGYLKNAWGLKNYFWNVWRRDPRSGKLIPGEDAKELIAFKPQSSNGIFMREHLLIIGKGPYASHMPANGTVHDSVCLDVPEKEAKYATEYLAEVLTRKIPQMDGLSVGCEVKVGYNWNEMESVLVKSPQAW